MRWFDCLKDWVHGVLLEKFLPSVEPVSIYEFGRMRGVDGWHFYADGWSTKRYAEHPRVDRVFSVDEDPGTIDVCRRAIGPEYLGKVIYIPSISSASSFIDRPIHLAYIDGPASPEVNLLSLEVVKDRLLPSSIVCVDDYNLGEKFLLIRDALRSTHCHALVGWTIVFWRKDEPRDTSWMTQEHP